MAEWLSNAMDESVKINCASKSEGYSMPTTSSEQKSVPTILYVDCSLHSGIDRRRLDGLRRYAAARNWRVETLEHRDCTPAALREALARLRPIGCAAECWCPDTAPRPPLFGRTPVVYRSEEAHV